MNLSKKKKGSIFWERWRSARALGQIKTISGKKCHDCGVLPGNLHKTGCDTERCPCCKGQLISCGCTWAEHPGWKTEDDPEGVSWWPPDSERLPWTGIMFEEEEKVARNDGQFVRWVERKGFIDNKSTFSFTVVDELGWKKCSPSHPDAMPDLNYGASKVVKKCPFFK